MTEFLLPYQAQELIINSEGNFSHIRSGIPVQCFEAITISRGGKKLTLTLPPDKSGYRALEKIPTTDTLFLCHLTNNTAFYLNKGAI
jgi:hypothetical protein